MNLCALFEAAVAANPDGIAIQFGLESIAYSRLDEAVRRCSTGLLRLGVSPGDRVVLALPNLPHFVVAWNAILRVGGVVVPFDPTATGSELSLLFEDAEPSAAILLAHHWATVKARVRLPEWLKEPILLGDLAAPGTISFSKMISQSPPDRSSLEIEDDDPAVAIYLPGKNGRPIGIEVAHGALAANARTFAQLLGVKQEDALSGYLPLTTSAGWALQMNAAAAAGAKLVLKSTFNPAEAVGSYRGGEYSHFIASPEFFLCMSEPEAFAESQTESRPPRLSVCVGGDIGDDLVKAFEKAYGGFILECYQPPDLGIVATLNQWRSGRRIGSLGHAITGVEVMAVNTAGREAGIGQVGELLIRASEMSHGMVGRDILSELKFRDGWFHTGDLGRMDINGHFYHTGRSDRRWLKAGEVFVPEESESLLLSYPGVREASVRLVAGEFQAWIVPENPSSVSEADLKAYLSLNLTGRKCPSTWHFVDELPT